LVNYLGIETTDKKKGTRLRHTRHLITPEKKCNSPSKQSEKLPNKSFNDSPASSDDFRSTGTERGDVSWSLGH